MRTILNFLFAVGILFAAADLRAQETPAKRLASIAGVAVEEYAKGVDSNGRVFAELEYEEARSFLTDARALADRIDDGRGPTLATWLDAMRGAIETRVSPDSLASLHAGLVAVLGPDATLDYPLIPIDLREGRALYAERCASCHGVAGLGDGPAAKGLVPLPASFGDSELMATVTPALMYRIVSVGVQGTSMGAFSDLSPAQRWNVVTYISTLRDRDEDRTRGRVLLAARCTRCGDGGSPTGHTMPWLAERNDLEVLAALRSGDAQLGMESQPTLSEPDARTILAALRASPVVVAPPARTPAAIATDVLRLLDDAVARARAGAVAEAAEHAFDAYIAFEPLESGVRTRDPRLVRILERHFADFRGSVNARDIPAATASRALIAAGLPQVVALAGEPSSGWSALLESLLIIVREGFEAMLILGAIAAFLVRTGNRARLRELWIGSLAGLVASAGLAVVLRTALTNVPASREVIEGATMLLAVAVLFSVSYWLLSKVDSARWQAFIHDRVAHAVSSGSAHALTLVAFLAVFREGAETALFYQALLARGGEVVTPVVVGLLAGIVVLGAIWLAFHRFGLRLPLRSFFATTSALLYYLAFVFMGKGLRELQEGNVLSITPLDGAPYVDLIGVYPSVETLAGQGLLLGLAFFAIWRFRWTREATVATPVRNPAPAAFPGEVEADASV